jgi:hypothetical protein
MRAPLTTAPDGSFTVPVIVSACAPGMWTTSQSTAKFNARRTGSRRELRNLFKVKDEWE